MADTRGVWIARSHHIYRWDGSWGLFISFRLISQPQNPWPGSPWQKPCSFSFSLNMGSKNRDSDIMPWRSLFSQLHMTASQWQHHHIISCLDLSSPGSRCLCDQWIEGPHIGAVSIPSPTLTVYTKVPFSIELEPSPPALGEALEACEIKALN